MSNDQSVYQLPAVGEGKRGEAGYLGYLLRQAANAFRWRADEALNDVGLTAPQFSVLTMLSAYPGHSNADLARLALLTPQTMSVIVGNLLKAGLIERRPHEVHGRIQCLAPTAAGRAALKRAKKIISRMESELVGNLPAEEQAVIRRWLVHAASPQKRGSR